MELIQFFLIFLIFFIFSFQIEFDWDEKQILIANDGKEDDEFGSSIDMIANISVIGAYLSNIENKTNQGKAYIYENNGTFWNEKQILIASDGEENDIFGTSVSISNNWILISSPFATVGNNTNQGKAYIYENNGTFWNQKQILIASDGEEYDQFGKSVSISNNSIVIGSFDANVGNNTNQGKAYIYENNGTSWNQKQILIANDGEENDQFGKSVSISNDLVLISSPFATVGNNTNQGKAYIYENNGTFWNQKQILIASDGEEYDQFGKSVSISNNSIVIGSFDANVGNNTNQGKAYIYENNGTSWNQKQILIANDGEEYDQFGKSVSISNNSIVIGSCFANVENNTNQGKAYIYENNGTSWNQKQILIANDGEANDYFGSSVSISNDLILIGSPNSNVNSNYYQGKAYIFQNNGTYWNETRILIASDGKDINEFGSSVAISGNISLISSPFSQVGNNSLEGKVYFFEYGFIPPQVDILNCSSLFSSFECYWNKINSTLNEIEYQISYQNEIQNWEVIQSPILNENVLYQIFNSSIYQDISGNVDYSIQIKACDNKTEICGNSSNQINLTTKIDSVKNLNYESYLNSIQLNWNYPNVPIINSIPKLNHYFLSYQIQNSNQSTNVSISNSSTSFQINNLESATNYLISIYSCRNEECLGNDKGEITTIQIQTKQPNTTTSSKSKTTTIALSIVIPIVVIVGIILTIIFIKKKKNKKEQNSISYSALKDEN